MFPVRALHVVFIGYRGNEYTAHAHKTTKRSFLEKVGEERLFSCFGR